MPLQLDDTIAAIASPPGNARRGIVRVSGPHALNASHQLFHPVQDVQNEPSSANNTTEANGGNSVDSAVRVTSRFPFRQEGFIQLSDWGVSVPASLMVWPTARSFTGQPMVEFHMPGAPSVLNGVLEHLWKLETRPAERGEFTMRAFLNGRIDLLQAEAVLGVIDAASHEELKLALSQLGGGMTHRLQSLRNSLISILGDLEAGLDFVEEDIEFISHADLFSRLQIIQDELQRISNQADSRLMAGWHPRIVLAGLPNAGKSTLLNRLTGNQTAIVSAIPGTTRDYLTAETQINGRRVTLVDTAGWENPDNEIMGSAQALRAQQLHGADLVLWCESMTAPPEDKELSFQLLSSLRQQTPNLLLVVTQCDRVCSSELQSLLRSSPVLQSLSLWRESKAGRNSVSAETTSIEAQSGSLNDRAVLLSAQSGFGVDSLLSFVEQWLQVAASSRGELLAATSARCRDSLRRASDAVESAITAVHDDLGDELISLDLRNALHELGLVMGAVYTDDILDHIFSHFCIGK